MHKVPPEAEIRALTGHQFPGGHYTIAHWENVLLTGCTGADLLPGGLAHPAALFHLPIVGSGTSIAEMFALGQAESDLSIMIESYEWEFSSHCGKSVNTGWKATLPVLRGIATASANTIAFSLCLTSLHRTGPSPALP